MRALLDGSRSESRTGSAWQATQGSVQSTAPAPVPGDPDRQARQVHEIDRHNQRLLVESPYVRADFMKKLDTSIARALRETVEPYRDVLPRRGHRPVRRPAAPAQRRCAGRSSTRRSTPATRSSWTSSPTSSPTGSSSCRRASRRARSGRSSSASTAWRGARRTSPTRRWTTRPTTSSPSGSPSAGSSRSHPRTSTSFSDRFRTLQRKANPLEEDPLLDHRPPAPADHRLAQDAPASSIPTASPSTASATAASRRCGFRRW